MRSKEEWRAALATAEATFGSPGQTAEGVRRLDAYRRCRALFVSLAPELRQVRINALVDGRQLILPGPGLKDGFYRIMPYSVPFARLALAVSPKGLPQFGQRLDESDLPGLGIGLLLTEALAVDGAGHRLGDGSGFFDLACALLKGCGALLPGAEVWAALPRARTEEPLPVDPWDVPLHGLINGPEVETFPPPPGLPDIHWPALSQQRIRKLSPLWKEWQRLGGKVLE